MLTEEGRHFYYICPKCGGDVEGCPDPECSGVGHHVDWRDSCDDDVPLAGLGKRFFSRMKYYPQLLLRQQALTKRLKKPLRLWEIGNTPTLIFWENNYQM